MNRRLSCLTLAVVALVIWPNTSPAPLVYRAGEGWTYEPFGGTGKWERNRAKDQLDVAEKAFADKDYGLALKAAHRTVQQWPLSDYAPRAQYLLGRCHEEKKNDERAFREYQTLLERYPKVENYEEVLTRQMVICDRFLGGQWFKLWGYVPFFPNMERTADMYAKLARNGPYTDIGAQALLKIGAAQEKRAEYGLAVRAYETAADRYNTKKDVAADALYKTGLSYQKQARTAEYDQGIAGKAIGAFTDFIALYPDDPRVPEAQKQVDALKTEQARGAFQIAKYYEKTHRPNGALVYYNEVLVKDPNSPYATEAKQHIETLKARVTPPPPAAAPEKAGEKKMETPAPAPAAPK